MARWTQSERRLVRVASAMRAARLLLVAAMVGLAVLGVAAEKEEVRVFRPLSYDELTEQVRGLAERYPGLARLSIAQEEFNLPSPGLCGKDQRPCQTQILHITNFSTYELDKVHRPEVYISGELHGDERIGPHASLEYARILLESENAWVRHLLNTRSIFITPITNSLGFDRNKREEGTIDPNRDYPIDQNPELCMRTITSRIVNELYRTHMFQLAITFHAGMEAIALEWGTKSRLKSKVHKSPDDVALLQLGAAMSRFAGPVTPRGRNYPVGRMNDLVYPVEGGMEDWAYAGNWDTESRRNPCSPQTFGGYDASRTIYSDAMLRVANILVETSDAKWPKDFGTSKDLLNPHSGNGHIARNVRLALALTDMVEPYIVWTDVSLLGENTIILRCEVGGSFEVDETQVTIEEKQTGKIVVDSPVYSGKTRWLTGSYQDREKWPFKSQFSVCFRMESDILQSADLVIRARARVDSAWSMKGHGNTVSPEGFQPQTHVANARTNVHWDMSNGGRKVKGRIDWYANPIGLTLGNGTEIHSLRRQNKFRHLLESTYASDDDESIPECLLFDDLGMSNRSPKIGSSSYSVIVPGIAFVSFAVLGTYVSRRRSSHYRLHVDSI